MNNQHNKVNIIFAGGSIPPMMAAALCIQNGLETYVYLERGRIFQGISNTENFHNIGFNTDRTTSVDDRLSADSAIKCIKELKEKGVEFFNFYTGESRGLKCAALAANAELTPDQFHVYLLEDGIDSYKKFSSHYGGDCRYKALKLFLLEITKREWFSEQLAQLIYSKLLCRLKPDGFAGKHCRRIADAYVGKFFSRNVSFVEEKFNKIMSSAENDCTDSFYQPNYLYPFPLSCLNNFTYYIQDSSKIDSIVKNTHSEKLYAYFNAGSENHITAAFSEMKISSLVKSLDSSQLNQYLSLIFGDYNNEVKKIFTRKQCSGKAVPERKLVYVNARLNTSFIHPATSPLFGMSDFSYDCARLDYDNLDEKYKSIFLFPSREDWEIFYNPLKKYILDIENSETERITACRKLFAIYANYIFISKLIYSILGDDYDIIIKNHPRTDVGRSEEWVDDRNLGVKNGGLVIDEALAGFHKSDSMGKYINLVSAAPSTENFEFLGVDVSFGGQPTSTYTGLSDDAQIRFIITESTTAISGKGDSHFDYSSVSARYDEGKMKWTDNSGTEHKTLFLNTINTLKYCRISAEKYGDSRASAFYRKLFSDCLDKNYPGAKDIDDQGFIIN